MVQVGIRRVGYGLQVAKWTNNNKHFWELRFSNLHGWLLKAALPDNSITAKICMPTLYLRDRVP